MHATTALLSLGLLASEAFARPSSHRGAPVSLASPSLSSSKGFALSANLTSPAAISAATALFNTSVQSWTVVGIHIGAGLDTAALNPSVSDVFFQNGTTNSSSSTNFVRTGAQFPYSIALRPFEDAIDPSVPGEFYTGVNVGSGSMGLSIDAATATARVNGSSTGTFVVCLENEPAYGRPQYPVRYLADASQATTDCVAVDLLAECATLLAVPEGADYDEDDAQEVACYA